MEETDNPKPTVVFKEKGFFETTKGRTILATGLGTLLFVILLFGLNYYDVIFVPLSFLPEKLAIPCPVQDQNCNKQEASVVKFKDKPAVGYKVPAATKIVNPVKVVDSRQFILPPYTDKDPIGLNQSFISGNICYTITYTVPNDSNISSIKLLPLKDGAQLISLGSELIKVAGQDLNLLLQLQKRSLRSGKTDREKCPVYNLDPSKYGQYENINSILKPQ